MAAVPVLVRRIAETLGAYPEVLRPIRIPAARLVKVNELERAIQLAAMKCGPDGGILVLLDCDDDCPAKLGPALQVRATPSWLKHRVAVVLAKCEYEAWFLASATSIAGKRGLSTDLNPPENPESIRGAKHWLTERMSERSYSETTDQAALTAIFDMTVARQADSFDKLWREVTNLIAPEAEATPFE